MTIKIILSINSLHPPLTGIGYYTHHLAQQLLENDRVDSVIGISEQGLKSEENLRLILKSKEQEKQTEPKIQKIQSSSFNEKIKKYARKIPGLVPAAHDARVLRTRLKLRHYGKSWLLHEPNYIPIKRKGTLILTIHDISHIKHAEMHPPQRLKFFKKKLPKAIAQADKVITDSEYVRSELLTSGMVDDETKVVSVPLGVESEFRPMAKEEVLPYLAQWNLRPAGYILSVATMEPRKNISRLLTAYQRLPQHIAESFPLVLCGASGWKNKDLLRQISNAKGYGKIICTGYLDRSMVQSLMAGAALFAFVPVYEGFGLPVLEAMASGVPVLASDIGALRELSGDVMTLVDPYNEDAIADGLLQILDEKVNRHQLCDAALQRARLFTWEKFGNQMIDVYQELN